MKAVALSGGTSFTALWIAEAFYRAGWKVHALCPRKEADYKGLKQKRLKLLKSWAEIHFSIDVTNESITQWLSGNPISVWIHHHHFMENFRSPQYDTARSEEVSLKPLGDILGALKKTNCNKIIFSGSYFEATAPTPYAKSKVATWKKLQELCAKDFLLSKVVIPDPIGPLENEDRLIPQMILRSQSNQVLELKSKSAENDHLPVRVLAKSYVHLAEELLKNQSLTVQPSGSTVDNESWVNTVNKELLQNRLKLKPCAMKLEDLSAPSYTNPPQEKQTFSWQEEWDHYATIYKENRDR